MAWGVPKLGSIVTVASGNITLTEPSGVAQGDLMVACLGYRDSAAFTLPAGWALVATQQSSGDIDASSGIASGLMAYIIRGGSPPALTFTRSFGDLGYGQIISYSGAVSSPYDTGSANTLASINATATTGSITTAQDNELIVAMVMAGDQLSVSAFDAATDPSTASGATDTTTAPTAGTWIERADNSTATGADGGLGIADAIRATAGATGTIQATSSAASRSVMIAGAFKGNDPPTVALNTPTDTATGVSTTPDLVFTGTDANADEIEYRLQLDTVNTFNSGGSGGVNTYYFDGSDAGATDPGAVWTNDANAFDGSTATAATVSSTAATGSVSTNYLKAEGTDAPGSGLPISVVRARIYTSASAASIPQTISAAIYTDGLGALLGIAQRSSISGDGAAYGPYTTLSEPSGGWTWTKVAALETKIYDETSSSGTQSVYRVEIEVTSDDVPLLNKLSVTPDATFTDVTNGADTHPFASGDQVKYTVQAGDILTASTVYYWRVAGIDPSGINTYGAWATTRSFTTASAGSAINKSDSITITENIKPELVSFINKSESVTITENKVLTLTNNINVSDTVTITENTKLLKESYAIKSESITITENIVVSVQAGALADLLVTVSDSITISESISRLETTFINRSESITITENIALLITDLYINVSDSVTITESIGRLLTSNISVSDSVTITEAVTLNLALTISVSDSVTVTENSQRLLTSSISVNDSSTITENVSLLITTLFIAVSESITVTESVNVLLSRFISVSDNITVSEVVSDSITPAISVSDNITASEALILLATSFVNKSESISLSESLAVQLPSLVINVSDSITISEALLLLDQEGIAILENIAVSENIVLFTDKLYLSVNDSVSVTESVTKLIESYVNKSETVTITESVAVIVTTLNISVQDSVSISESVKLLITSSVTVSDSITVTENVNVLLQGHISISDNVLISEATAQLLTSFVSVSDSTTVSETVAVSIISAPENTIGVSDTLTITENIVVAIQPTITPQISVNDTITITELITVRLASFVNKSESVTVSENISVFIPTLLVNISDSITISESILVQTQEGVAVLDNISISENVVVFTDKLYLSVNQSITVSESANELLQSFINTSETITVNEAVNLLISQLFISVSDTVTITEAVSISESIQLNVSDSVTITENKELLLQSSISVSDSIAVSEIISILKSSVVSVTDLILVKDQRTNFVNNPSFESDLSSWQNGGVAIAQSTIGAIAGTKSIKFTSNGGYQEFHYQPVIPVVTGKTYQAQARVTTLAAHTPNAGGSNQTRAILYCYWQGAGGETIWTGADVDLATIRTGYLLSGTLVAPAGATNCTLYIFQYGVGDAYYDAFLVEQSDSVNSYFDGSSSGAAWTGTANSSISQTSTPYINLLETSYINISDTVTISESVNLSITTLFIPVNDTINIGENVTVVIQATDTPQITESETATITENVQVFIPTLSLSVSDSITLSEAVTVNRINASDRNIIVSDSIAVSENAIANITALNISVLENTSLSESVTLLSALQININDYIYINDGSGKALTFAGSSGGYVSASYTFPTDAYSVLFWYKASSNFGNAEGWISQAGSMSIGRQGLNDVQVYAYLNAPGDFAGLRHLRVGSSLTIPSTDNKWHSRAYLIYVNGTNNGALDVYEDGILLSTTTTNYTGSTLTPSGNLFIGSQIATGGLTFGGSMDRVVIVNRKITSTEVTNFHNSHVLPSNPGAIWDMDEGVGTAVSDKAPGHHNGVFAGAGTAPTWINSAIDDNPNVSILTTLAVSENITISEVIGRSESISINVSQLITVSESLLVQTQKGVAVLDNIAVSENLIFFTNILYRSLSDTITVSENRVISLSLGAINTSEHITISENVSVRLPHLTVNVNDSLTVAESVSTLVTSFINRSDLVTLTELLNVSSSSDLSVSDLISLSDTTITLISNYNITVNDTVSLSEILIIGRTRIIDAKITVKLLKSVVVVHLKRFVVQVHLGKPKINANTKPLKVTVTLQTHKITVKLNQFKITSIIK